MSSVRLGRNIRARRLSHNLTVLGASRAAGITHPEWLRFESGERLPNLGRLQRIADAVGCQMTALLVGVRIRWK